MLPSRKFLRKVFDALDRNSDGYLDQMEITACLGRLGYNATAPKINKLIWEADDDGDGLISWKEFCSAHLRLVNYDWESSRVAFEPRGFYNLIGEPAALSVSVPDSLDLPHSGRWFVEFLVLDKDGDGQIDQKELVEVFYRRYGRAGAMAKVAQLDHQGALDQ